MVILKYRSDNSEWTGHVDIGERKFQAEGQHFKDAATWVFQDLQGFQFN